MRRNDRKLNNPADIESVIESSDVCRVAFANGFLPYIVTMNFGYCGGTSPCLYFHCAKYGKKLDMIRKNNYVCFEMDTDHELYEGDKGCDWGMRFRSVVGYGYINILSDQEEKKKGLDTIMHHYSGRNGFYYNESILDSTVVLKLEITELTGKKK